MQSVVNTLNKARDLVKKDGIDLQVTKVNYYTEGTDLISSGKADGLIYFNIHVLNYHNEILKTNNKEMFEYVQAFYYSKYGLYINKNRNPVLKDLEDVKKHSNLKVLLAVAFSYIGPCDTPRSLVLLNKLGLIKIDPKVLQEKKFGISFEDLQNHYNLEFIKASQIPDKFAQNPQKYDLMANWPAFMNPYPYFVRIGATIEGNEEPTDDFIASYDIGLSCLKSHKDSEQIKTLKAILNNPQVKEFHLQEGGAQQDYFMVKAPEKTTKHIKELWLQH
ncbi:MAG: MetQ/NlpA family ABC transporter substrate-binding protein [Candidatus Phytoplasma asteris]|uniref:ABC-type uncharacterized transport system, periplasmic component n=2 Tax=16SrI (Aster yellows group) TaxID=3042590 RepID=Q6YRB8_ONYPE|nr:MetQ/NlpA family ABC transporter substrate-binding protein ['Chrysanthemum coronarium' phytoplasma]TKA87699.1 MAG: metal ABC transporter substrate-binding protein [Periwinkle leaf yellowing phytoplasma]WEX20064.1 MAG: MetQ/NlpA family ABC transporter substrate-binding protein [Candidatus Phytoplasma asteris]BAD04182.1 ABC-type uncharacterized transport system, periplasmic component [Onion yellows phytoplasma OY-M]GAK73527.1 ABC-type metal ion transport system, periplasmic component/surface a